MENTKHQIYECMHCNGSGTCSSNDSYSCFKCMGSAKCKSKEPTKGLVCCCCKGIGKTFTPEDAMKQRIIPLLGYVLPCILIILCYSLAFTNSEYTSQFITFSSTVIGIIITYYFTQKRPD